MFIQKTSILLVKFRGCYQILTLLLSKYRGSELSKNSTNHQKISAFRGDNKSYFEGDPKLHVTV